MNTEKNDKISESYWDIPTPDGARIYGATNKSEQANSKCIVITHGLTGHMNQYQFKRAAMTIPCKGYDVIRFNLYWDQPGGRRLHECNLQIHAADLNTVLATMTGGYDKVFVVGHSYGGPTVMVAQPKEARAVSLWDPCFDLPETIMKGLPLTKFDDGYYLDWAIRHVLGKQFVEEGKSRYGEDECLVLSEKFGRPVQVVMAEHGGGAHRKVFWHSRGHPDSQRVDIKEADHSFYNGDTADVLIRETLAFFNRF